MAGQGPAHLFVYYQKPYRMSEQGEVEELRQPAEFTVTDGKCPFPDFSWLALIAQAGIQIQFELHLVLISGSDSLILIKVEKVDFN